ncbi:hypothetical protein BLNAU_24067 [Blattamonas nauphoetae]|uniref:Uncharacterized protein n=1 Tax=Blattamonas nauphoetae TaxID=2049346 RepID=A0ABQ9WNI1_9EUKA|nr:hypothetical protein BLNAU_24067 [Blattamonas nauphoetae]
MKSNSSRKTISNRPLWGRQPSRSREDDDSGEVCESLRASAWEVQTAGNGEGAMMVKLVKKMKSLLMAEPTSGLFTHLSPHVVLLNGQGEMQLDLKHGQSVVGKEGGTVTGENELKQQQEEQRWQAPETDRKDKSEIDVVAASVLVWVFC